MVTLEIVSTTEISKNKLVDMLCYPITGVPIQDGLNQVPVRSPHSYPQGRESSEGSVASRHNEGAPGFTDEIAVRHRTSGEGRSKGSLSC